MNYLLEQGKIAIRVRKHLREFVNGKENRNNYINDLIEKDAQNGSESLTQASEAQRKDNL